MAEPTRKQDSGIEPDIAPDLRAIQGGGENTSDRGNLRAVNDQELHPEAPNKEGSVADQEGAPSNVIQGPWANNVSSSSDSSRGSSKGKLSGLKSTLIKKGPLGAIIAGVLGGGIVITSFLGPVSLLLNLKENYVNKFDTQNTSMTVRLNKVIVSKLTSDATSGTCKIITIACKFSRPSNSFLNKLSDSGVVAKNKAGDVIEKRLLGFPNERPVTYEFIDRSGKTISTDAKNFSKVLTTNAEFRAAFHRAFNPRFISYADSVAKRILAKFGAGKADSLKNTTDTKKTTDTLNKESAGTPNATSEGGGASGTKTIITDALEEEVQHSAKKVIASGGDPAIIVGTIGCIGLDAPGFVSKVARAYQMRQLIKYGVVFLTVADAIKAGDATPKEVEAMGNILTSVYKDDTGKITNNSAMDSFGVKNGLFGDTTTTGYTKKFNKMVPGGEVASITGFAPAVALASNPGVKKTCNLIVSPQAQIAAAGVEAALSVGTAGVAAPIIAALRGMGKIALYFGAVDKLVGVIIDSGVIGKIVDIIPTEKITEMFMGDLTKNIQGEDAGNAMTSGIAHYMGQTANAGGNAPLNKTQALAYNHLSNDVKLAYAEEDRATLSPFDTSSPNTLVGSMVSQMLPYYSKLSSGPGILSFLGNMVGSAIGTIAGRASAASDTNTEAGYSMCSDTTISSTDVAAGPFCNIIYGIPPEYINEDTSAVIAAMSGQIDDITGEPIENSDLANWLADCTTGDTEGVAGCTITDKKTAEYALYFIDHRIQKDMDGEDTPAADAATTAPSTTSSQGVGTPDNVTSKGSGWTLTDGLDYSAIACAAGTQDEGLYTHPTKGFTIRKCAVAGDDVASIVSEKAVALFAAAKSSGVNLTLESGFRSYEEQAKLFRDNCHGAGICSPPTAPPGNSQHEAGIALDIKYNGSTICFGSVTANCTNKGLDWLKANAAKYGFINLPLEAWHWSTSGT